MMAFLDVQDGDYVNSQNMPRLQISAMGGCMDSKEDTSYLNSLNFNPWIVSIDSPVSYSQKKLFKVL